MSLSLSVSQNGSQGNGSQRASAATRARRAAAAAAAETAASIQSPHKHGGTGSELVLPATETGFDATHTQQQATQNNSAARRSSRGRNTINQTQAHSMPSATPAEPATPAAAAAAAAPIAPDPSSASRKGAAAPTSSGHPLVIDDGSSSFLTKFTFPPTDCEPGGIFLSWTHYSPTSDTLHSILMQQTGLYRIYTFEGRLTDLRPMGLYMSGMRDADYRSYVLNGLCEQDSKDNYEYEFLTGDEDIDPGEPSNPDEVRAQLRLYKQMGDSTRVPVCIAHLKYEPVRLGVLTSHGHRQDERQYQSAFSKLLTGVTRYFDLLRTRRAVKEAELARQATEEKVAEELERLPCVISLRGEGEDLLRSILELLNGKKSLIRDARARNEALRAQIDAMRPKRRASLLAEDEVSESSEDEFDEVSLSDEESKQANMDRQPDQQPNTSTSNARRQPLAGEPHADFDDDGPRPMEIEQPSPAAAAPKRRSSRTNRSLPGSGSGGTSFPPTASHSVFPSNFSNGSLSFGFDSIEPAAIIEDATGTAGSLHHGGATLSIPPTTITTHGATSRSTSSTRVNGGGAGSGVDASAPRPTPEFELSPPRPKAMVRKRSQQQHTYDI